MTGSEDLVARLGAGWGRCISCGFLALHPTRGGGGWYETEPGQRATGSLIEVRVPGFPNEFSEARPDCFVGAFPLSDEFAAINEAALREFPDPGQPLGGIIAARALAMLEMDRGCHGWFRYQRGLSPREHFERSQMIEIRQRQEQLDDARHNDRKAWELALENSRRDWNDRANRQLILIGIVGLAIGIAASLPEPERSHLYDVVTQTAQNLGTWIMGIPKS